MEFFREKLAKKGYVLVNYIYGKGAVISKDGKYGFANEDGEILAECEMNFADAYNFGVNGGYMKKSVDAIISESLPKDEKLDKYILNCVELAMTAMGIVRYEARGSYQEKVFGLSEEEYQKVVKGLYSLIKEIISRGGVSFKMFDYNKTSEFQAFITLLSERSGVKESRFRSRIEQEYQEAYHFSWVTMDTILQNKPKLSFSAERSCYQDDCANETCYTKTVEAKKYETPESGGR